MLPLVYEHVDEDIDKAMTAWSFKDQRARVVAKRVVRRMLVYMKGLFQEARFPAEQPELRTWIIQSFVHGDRSYPDVCEPKDSDERKKLVQDFVELICTPIEN